MKINEDTIALLEEITERFEDLEGSEVTHEAEDLEGWPIKPWELDDTPEDEISVNFIAVRLWISDAKAHLADGILLSIIAAAKEEADLDLSVSGESRKWVPGARGVQQINLTTDKA